MHARALAVVAALAAAALAAPGTALGAGCDATATADWERLAELALARGDWPRAAAAYACATETSGDPEVAERATRAAYDNHQLGEAVRGATRWLVLQPGREEARRFLATSLLRMYRNDAAAEQFRAILDSAYEDRAQGYTTLLATLSGERNDTGAALVMERLAERDPDLAEAHYARSVLWQQADHGQRALDAARRALELRPGWRLAELAEVRALLTLGRLDEGLGLAATLATDADPLSQLNYGWLLLGARRDDEAREVFEAMRRGPVGVSQALEGLGTLAFARRDYDTAARLFTELAQGSRGDETALAYLGLIADEQGKPALAVRYLERVTAGSRAVASQLRAFRLMEQLGAAEGAQLALDDFLAQSPESVRDVVVGRANQLADAGRGEEALALFRRARQLYPEDDDLGLAEGFVLERLDRVGEAVRTLQAVLERRPDDPTALNSLGYTLVDRTRRIEEGHAMIMRALEMKPDNYAIMDSAGWALFRLKRHDEALGWLGRAWERSRDPEVAAHLGEVLWATGRRAEAQELWNRASADAPDNRNLRRTMERHAG
jgi:tetratricopeptide (TPR) repeat protein